MVKFTLTFLIFSLFLGILGLILAITSEHVKKNMRTNQINTKALDKIISTLVIMLYILIPIATFLTFFTIASH